MNKYLIEILKNHSSLILPGIGALMVTNRKTGEIKFNPHLTFNDGALSSFIASAEGIDKTEAQNKVAKFTSEIKQTVDKGETYDIFEFGTIFKDKNGDMAFEMARNAKISVPKETKSNVKKTVINEVDHITEQLKSKTADSEKKINETVKKTTKRSEKAIKKSTENTTKKVTDTVKATAKIVDDISKSVIDKTKKTADNANDEIKKVKNTYIPSVEKDKLPEVPKIIAKASNATSEKSASKTDKETVAVTAEYTEEKRKKRWWPLILLLLLIGLVIAAYFFKSEIMHFLGWDKSNKIENINHYPDADGDQIPDFADIDLTNGTDADHDGIDDLADLDYTHGEDLDHDGIDDKFAALMTSEKLENTTDPFAMNDEDNDGIPDYADIDLTEGVDKNENGIDDLFDASITLGTDEDKDCIDDSLAKIALLNHIKSQMDDVDADGIPDYADTDLTQGTDINKNGIDDEFESIDADSNGDGLNDSILLAIATHPHLSSNENDEMATEENDNTDTGKINEENDETIEETDNGLNNSNSEEVAIDETVESKHSEENLTATANQSKSDYSVTGNFHAIGAAFSEKSNAENYTSDMNSKGFNASIIGRFDGLYLVSLKQYTSLGDAKSDLSNIRNTSSSAWVFKH